MMRRRMPIRMMMMMMMVVVVVVMMMMMMIIIIMMRLHGGGEVGERLSGTASESGQSLERGPTRNQKQETAFLGAPERDRLRKPGHGTVQRLLIVH
eukprot:2434383-Rhodomonas_salina.1